MIAGFGLRGLEAGSERLSVFCGGQRGIGLFLLSCSISALLRVFGGEETRYVLLCYAAIEMDASSLIYVGTAGWSYKDWEGIVYPAQIKKSQHPVEYLAHYIDVLEINTSFYGHIKPEWGKLWCRMARAVNPQFMFTAKLNRAFTHSPIAVIESTSAETIRATEEDERLAKEGLDSMAAENMLGALLVQFPISFKNTNQNRDHLDLVIEKFKQYPLVVEVRHNSWTNEGTPALLRGEGRRLLQHRSAAPGQSGGAERSRDLSAGLRAPARPQL